MFRKSICFLLFIVSTTIPLVAVADEVQLEFVDNAWDGHPNLGTYPPSSGAVIDYEIAATISDIEGDGPDSRGLAELILIISTNTNIRQPLPLASPTVENASTVYTVHDDLWTGGATPVLIGGFGFEQFIGGTNNSIGRILDIYIRMLSWDADVSPAPGLQPRSLTGVGFDTPATAVDSGGNPFVPVDGDVRDRWYLIRGQINVPDALGDYRVSVSPTVHSANNYDVFVIRNDVDLTVDQNSIRIRAASYIGDEFVFKVDGPTQACCLGVDGCVELTPLECANFGRGGVPQGVGTTCGNGDCPPPEACCFWELACADADATTCVALGGEPQGSTTSCPASACAAPTCDKYWDSAIGNQNLGFGHVLAISTFDDGSGNAIYAGGTFTDVLRIARWTGREWIEVGGGTNDEVHALKVFDDGSGPALYVGGDFTIAGGQPAHRIAKWDGATWSPVGQGFDNRVRALEVFDDGNGPALYAGGHFRSSGSTTVERIARWNGTEWLPVGGGMSSAVFVLATYSHPQYGGLYAGGGFSMAGGQEAARIARWDGTQWHPLGVGFSGGNVHAIQPVVEYGIPGIIVGGSFNGAGGEPTNRIARWRFGTWSQVGVLGMNGQVYALDSYMLNGERVVIAGGQFSQADGKDARVAYWDNSAWQPFPDVDGATPISADYIESFFVNEEDSLGEPALYVGGLRIKLEGESSVGIVRYGCDRFEACCLDDGTCVPDLLITECGTLGGLNLGPGTSCATDQCPQPQACCFDDGSCQTVPVTFCEIRGGVPQGPGTDCNTVACEQPGACCFEDGVCDDLLSGDCVAQGGLPRGEGTSCGMGDCPNEACCLFDGECRDILPVYCLEFEGTPQGPGSACGPASCPLEACCFPNGNCILLFPDACLVRSGIPVGAGSTCDEANCPPGVASPDFDADGDVDLTDFAKFFVCFRGPDRLFAPTPPDCYKTDLSLDNDVDLGDYALFSRCFSGAANPPPPLCSFPVGP